MVGIGASEAYPVNDSDSLAEGKSQNKNRKALEGLIPEKGDPSDFDNPMDKLAKLDDEFGPQDRAQKTGLIDPDEGVPDNAAPEPDFEPEVKRRDRGGVAPDQSPRGFAESMHE